MADDSNLLPLLHPFAFDATEDGKDAPFEILFAMEKIPRSPLVVPCFTAQDPDKGFGFAYPSIAELTKFGVPQSVLVQKSKENLLRVGPRPQWLVAKPITSYKVLTLYSKTPFVSEYILDEKLMLEAQEMLKASSLIVGIPRRETMFVTDIEHMNNPELVPNFIEFIKHQYEDSKPIAGPKVTPIIYHFRQGKAVGYIKQEGKYEPEVPKVEDVTDMD